MMQWRRCVVFGALLLVVMRTGIVHAQAAPIQDVVALGGTMDRVDRGNSTSVLWSLNSVYTGTGVDTFGFSAINVFLLASQSSATNGLEFQWGPGGTMFGTLTSYTLNSYTMPYTFTAAPQARFFRIKYTNGSVTLTSFVLQTTLRGRPDMPLVSVAGAVDLKAGALVSANTGFGNTVLSSGINSGWRAPLLSSVFVTIESNYLTSQLLVPSVTGQQVAVYRWDIGLKSAAPYVGFYSGTNGAVAPISSLWVSEYGAQGGISVPMSGSQPEPFEQFRTALGSALWWVVGADTGTSNRSRVNLLWSYK